MTTFCLVSMADKLPMVSVHNVKGTVAATYPEFNLATPMLHRSYGSIACFPMFCMTIGNQCQTTDLMISYEPSSRPPPLFPYFQLCKLPVFITNSTPPLPPRHSARAAGNTRNIIINAFRCSHGIITIYPSIFLIQ